MLAELTDVIDSQMFIMGPQVGALEREMAAYCGVLHGVGCASGSDALLLALMAFGIGPGDAVLTTPFTFFATAGSIARTGAKAVFVDVDRQTFNIDPGAAADALRRHADIRAIIPVHLYGGCADMDPLIELSRTHGIPIIEDAAQAVGAEYKERRAGSIGDIGCFSFFPTKNLGAYGDAGMLTTNNPALADRLSTLRVHGSKVKYDHEAVGINSRLDALQAAVLRVKLRHLEHWTAQRQNNALLYRTLLEDSHLPIELPKPAPYQTRHVFHQFGIAAQRRDELQAYLLDKGIGSEIYYPVPLHLQKCFAGWGYRAGDFPISEQLAQEALALPIHSDLEAGDIEYVAETIKNFYRPN